MLCLLVACCNVSARAGTGSEPAQKAILPLFSFLLAGSSSMAQNDMQGNCKQANSIVLLLVVCRLQTNPDRICSFDSVTGTVTHSAYLQVLV